MASKSYPRAGYNSGSLTELEHERLVQAQAPDGLIGHPDDQSLVYADGSGTRIVKIRSGRRAMLRGSQYDSGDTDISMPSLAANATGSPRIDLIVLRLSRTDYTVTEAAITGTPAASPSAPSPLADTGSTGSWDLPVAQVRVESGATTIAADKVTNIAWYLGSDGQILCKAGGLPPHEAGRRTWRTDTSRGYISTGVAWLLTTEDSGSVTASISSGWTGTAINSVYRRNGLVFLTLAVQRTGATLATSAYSTIATIPAGFWPVANYDSTAIMHNNAGSVTVTVGSNGNVVIRPWATLTTTQYVSLSAITYPAA